MRFLRVLARSFIDFFIPTAPILFRVTSAESPFKYASDSTGVICAGPVGTSVFGARTRVGSEKIEKSAKKFRWRKLGTIKTRSTANNRCDDAASHLTGVQIPIHRCKYRAKIRICNETVKCDQH